MTRLLASQKFRRLAFQSGFIVCVGLVVLSAILVGHRNIAAQGIATGFSFLERTTGWPVNFAVIPVTAGSTYAWVLWAGLLNTMLVGFLTLLLATLLGLVLALFRVSSNTLMKLVGTTYVEVFRNVPVILQVFFWYALLTHLPSPREAIRLGVVVLSNRGLMFPSATLSGADLLILLAAVLMTGFALWIPARRTGAMLRWSLAGVLLATFFAALLLSFREIGEPLWSVPELKGLRFVGGITLKPEFAALLIGLVLFGAAYICEIIRGGLLSVDRGKLEAGTALGLTGFQVNRLIRIPLAIRAMLPSLTNQYVWLMKATTVGIAIGYPDYFAIVSTSINQTGQTLELLALLMAGFILINYSISFAMNRINDHIKIKGRS
ncbi:ABC transporter permease subunit [Nitratireductor luteus]|uniref:ABC transporter permease subunit n=1 Tax=Nitratireductor luteus TaxID=2976980 RepID=UPI00223ED409|nr:ABC transporter permease subunit [Nitratireductor luteus]